MSIKIIFPKCLARNLNENIVIEVPSDLIQESGYLIVRRQGKKLVTQQLPDYWGHDLSNSGNAPHILFADCGRFNCGIPSSSEKEEINKSYSPAKTFSRSAARNSYGGGATDKTYSRGKTFRAAKPDHLRQTQHSVKSSYLSSEGSCPCPPKSTVDSSMFDASCRIFPSGATSCFREFPKDFRRPQTANTTRNATPNTTFTPCSQTVPRGVGYPRGPGFHDPNQTFSRASGKQSCSRYRYDDKSHDARFHPWASRYERSMIALEDSSVDITPDIIQSPNEQSACGPGVATQPPMSRTMPRPANQTFAPGFAANRTMPRVGNQTFLVNLPRSLTDSLQTSSNAAPRTGRSRPDHDTFSRSANRSRFKGSYSSGCGHCYSGSKDTSIPYLPSDRSYEERFRPYDSSIQRTWSSLQDSSDDMMFAFGGPMNMSQEGKYNVIKHMSELSAEESKLDECACTLEPFESIVSHTSPDV